MLNLISPLVDNILLVFWPAGTTNDLSESISTFPVPFGCNIILFSRSVTAPLVTFDITAFVILRTLSKITPPVPLAVIIKSSLVDSTEITLL